MRLESRVSHLEAVRLEELCDGLRICLLLLHADSKRLDSPHQEERVIGRETAAGRVDGEVHLIAKSRVVASDDASHDVVVARKVLGARLVHDIGAELQRVAEHGREHRVVHDHESLGVGLVDGLGNGGDIDDLDQRVGRCLEEDHGRLVSNDVLNLLDGGGVNVMNDDALVGSKVRQQTVGTSVQVISGDDLVSGAQDSGDDVQGTHSRTDGERSCSVHDLGHVSLEVRARGVAGSCVIVLLATTGRRLFERGRLVDGDAGGSILILGLGIDQFGGKGVSSTAGRGARRRGRRRQIVAVEVDLGNGLVHGLCAVIAAGRGAAVVVWWRRRHVFVADRRSGRRLVVVNYLDR